MAQNDEGYHLVIDRKFADLPTGEHKQKNTSFLKGTLKQEETIVSNSVM